MKLKTRGKPAASRKFSALPERLAAELPAADHAALARSLRFIAQNYTRPIQLDEVVAVSGMSRRGFTKAFNRHFGHPPGSYLRHRRIEFAKRLLREQDLPLKALAKVTGFRSENTFCIAFQRATGMSAKRFQRQTWQSATPASFRLNQPAPARPGNRRRRASR